MRFVYDVNKRAKLDDFTLPEAELLSVGKVEEGKPVRVVLAISAEEVIVAHSARLDQELDKLTSL